MRTILASTSAVVVVCAACGPQQTTSAAPVPTIDLREQPPRTTPLETDKPSKKRALLSRLVGTHSLYRITGLAGANAMFDYNHQGGGWDAGGSSIEQGERVPHDIKLNPDDLDRLNSMALTIAEDLSATLTVEGDPVLAISYREHGLDYQLSEDIQAYDNPLLQGLSAKTTFHNGSLYLLLKDELSESQQARMTFDGVYGDAAMVTYDVNSKELLLEIFNTSCCDQSTFFFRRRQQP